MKSQIIKERESSCSLVNKPLKGKKALERESGLSWCGGGAVSGRGRLHLN